MTPELEALARRAVACKRFAPRFGMRSSGGWTVVGLATRGWKEGDRIDMLVAKQPDVLSDVVVCSMQLEDFLPDLTDAATLGCLERLAEDHLGFAICVAEFSTNCPNNDEPGSDLVPTIWFRVLRADTLAPVIVKDGTRFLAGPTRIAALVAALEAAP